MSNRVCNSEDMFSSDMFHIKSFSTVTAYFIFTVWFVSNRVVNSEDVFSSDGAHIQSLNYLAPQIFFTSWLVSDLVRHSEDMFSSDGAHVQFSIVASQSGFVSKIGQPLESIVF